MISFHKIQSDPSLGWQWQFIHQVELKERKFVVAWLAIAYTVHLCWSSTAGCKNLQCGYGPFLGWESCYVRWCHNIAVPWDTRHGNEELPFEQTLKSLPRVPDWLYPCSTRLTATPLESREMNGSTWINWRRQKVHQDILTGAQAVDLKVITFNKSIHTQM